VKWNPKKEQVIFLLFIGGNDWLVVLWNTICKSNNVPLVVNEITLVICFLSFIPSTWICFTPFVSHVLCL
jgi:hypothetical protein